MSQLAIKRIYDAPSDNDGTRVLVDRLWPRGVSKDSARVELWLKNIAPSAGLRKWFDHDHDKWAEFEHAYREELDANQAAVAQLRQLLAKGKVTLLYGSKDTEFNQAVVLRDYLDPPPR